MLLPAQHHDAFRAAYHAAGEQGTGDDDTWARARGWAVALSLVYLAHLADNPQLAGIGRRTLSAVFTWATGGEAVDPGRLPVPSGKIRPEP